MAKRLLSIAAVVVLFGSVAMAQAGPGAGSLAQPDTVTAQGGPMDGPDNVVLMRGGPGGEFMQAGGRSFTIRTRGPMGPGPMMRFHGRGMDEWWANPELAERIGLSDQQKQQLEKIGLDSRLKTIDLRADLEKAQVILGPMLQTYHPDENAVLAQVEKVSQARASLDKEHIQTMLASRNVLTEEQWNKLKTMRMGFHHDFERRSVHRGSMMRKGPPAPPSK